MQYPIGFCIVHGFFPATAVAIDNASVHLEGIQTRCPRCGRTAEILSGKYEAVGDRLNLLLDASISPAALAALRDVAERLQRNKITPHEAKSEAEKISPKAGRLFDVADWSDGAKATLYASIIGAIALVAAAKLSAGGSDTPAPPVVIERIIERRTETLRDSTSLPYIPIPTPRPR